jgi:hypothetical protein
MYIQYNTANGNIVTVSNKPQAAKIGFDQIQYTGSISARDLISFYSIDATDQSVVLKSDSDQLVHAQRLTEIKRQRQLLLDKSDWTQLPDVTITAEKRSQWQQYRQALRDITQHLPAVMAADYQPNWPEKPE